MNKTGTIAAALLAAALLTPAGTGQPPATKGSPFGKSGIMFAPFDFAYMRSFGLLVLPEVCKEIGVEGEQLRRLDDALADLKKQYDDGVSALRDVPREDASRRAGEVRKKVSQDGAEALKKVLRPEQLKRYEQISFTQRGEEVLEDAQVLDRLKLTEEQRRDVRRIKAEREQAEGRMLKVGMTSEQMQRLHDEQVTKTVALFTAEQRRVWDDLRGPRLDIPPGQYFRARKLPSR